MRSQRLIISASILILATTAGCGSGSGDAAAIVERLEARIQHLEDSAAIQKLQSKYAHYLFTQDYDKIFAETYAQNNPDVSVEFSDSGIYRGPDKVRALYDAFAVTKTIPGFFILHMTVNPYIEIAADGHSARSHWLSPGATGSNTSAGWVWGPYYIDYVKENGEWRILHSNLAPTFRNSYDISWANAPDNGTVRGVLDVEPDGPPSLYRPYHEEKQKRDIFARYPELPEPY